MELEFRVAVLKADGDAICYADYRDWFAVNSCYFYLILMVQKYSKLFSSVLGHD